MLRRFLKMLAGEWTTALFGLCVASLYLLPCLVRENSYRPEPSWFFLFLGLAYLAALLFRSCFRFRCRRLASLPDRMQPDWLFKLTIFCVEWVRTVAGAVLMIWWVGGLYYIHNFFGEHSALVPWLVGCLHSAVLYLLAQLNLRLFDLIGYGATQD